MDNSLVYLSYLFPPLSCGANTRNTLLPRYLPRFGWKISVLTSTEPRGLPLDYSLLKKIPEETVIRRVRHLDVMTALRKFTGKQNTQQADSFQREENRITLKDILKFYSLIPDRAITWMPDVVPAGINLVHDTNAKIILSAGPHHSLHLHAWLISRITGIKWIPYFGDLWIYDSYMQYPPGPIKWVHGLLERAVIRNANGIITTTPLSSEYFIRRYGSDCPPCTEVINGYDPENLPDITSSVHRTDTRLTITYTGNLLGFNAPDYLPDGIEDFLAANPEAEVKFVFVGSFDPGFKSRLQSDNFGKAVEFLDRVPADEVRKYQLEADVLMTCVADRPGCEVKNNAKLAEYVSVRKPILILCRRGDMADFLEEMQGGYFSEPNPEAVSKILQQIYMDWKSDKMRGPANQEVASRIFDMRENIRNLADFLRKIVDNETRF
ncbi:MAG: hypothetical protein GQ565_05935 [Candidatus Aegiribacteria sp.]|nr:hypothetical protein [Candidatus Aegiribacteria sp.]